jgi:hypothetical protein
MPGCNKTARKKKVSSGARKARAIREGANQGSHKRPIADEAVMSFLRSQDLLRWPLKDTADLYAKLNRQRHVAGQAGGSKRVPSSLGFPLLETLAFHENPKTVDAVATLLVAAALKVKRVKRHPGWVLQRTYNLKNRPIEII